MSLSALQASAYLHHLHLGSREPDRLASFYASVMDMTSRELPNGAFALHGPARRLQISPGANGKLLHAGFAVRSKEDLQGLRVRATERELALSEFTTSYFEEGSFAVDDPDGNTIVFGVARPEDPVTDRCIRGPLQHLTLASRQIEAIEHFYADKLGFGVSDRVLAPDGRVMTCFMRGNHEHHNLACFRQDRTGIDHHSYEAGEWDTIRDWCDHAAAHDVQLMWGPGRHGPGNNLFIFIVDPDGNWIEISAELEVVHDRPVKHWPHVERTLNLWGRGILRAEAGKA